MFLLSLPESSEPAWSPALPPQEASEPGACSKLGLSAGGSPVLVSWLSSGRRGQEPDFVSEDIPQLSLLFSHTFSFLLSVL